LAASIPYRNRCLGEDRALLALFTLLRGRGILRSWTSDLRSSEKVGLGPSLACL